ncbi:MAG: M23 family metallopeptidase [Alphaproteobacteria bacterium]|nr:M23 family metallopeptidase [Alphaproteobacteria bacterium]
MSKPLSALFDRISLWPQRWAEVQLRHPHRVMAAIAGLLMVGGTASYAVATLGPDASRMPTTEWVQSLPLPDGLQRQSDALPDWRLYRSEQTRSNDTAESLLNRLGIQDPGAVEFIRQSPLARAHLLGKAGRMARAESDHRNQLQELSVRWIADEKSERFQRLVLQRRKSGWGIELQTGTLSATTQLAGGIIQSSLFTATDQARIPDSIAVQLADIFSGDIDFHRNLRKGDRFSVVYETLEADGEPMRAGRVLSAEFVNNSKTHSAVWYKEPGQPKGEYYSLNGQSLRRAYLTSPLAFSRVTSGMGMRFHPIHQTWKAHTGVDYAAPTGTPVRSVGEGVVEMAGWSGGYGNTVVVRHRNGHSTLYAHLSKINVRKGQNISQGQELGAVGATGTATGPHLHFEFRVNGVHRDPLTLARQSESRPISAAAKSQFDQHVKQAQTDLAAAASVQLLAVQ